MTHSLMTFFLVLCLFFSGSLVTTTPAYGQKMIAPSELARMLSILKYIDERLNHSETVLSPKVRLNSTLESLELLGIDTGDRSRFNTDMTNSKMAVVLLGGQLPSRRKVDIANAVKMLNLKEEQLSESGLRQSGNVSPGDVNTAAAVVRTRDKAVQVKPVEVSAEEASAAKRYQEMVSKASSENRFSVSEKTHTSVSSKELYIDLDAIVNKAVSKAERQ